MAIGQTPKQTSRWRQSYWLEETHRMNQSWQADRARIQASNVRLQRFGQAADVLGAGFSYLQGRALAGAEAAVSKAGLQASLAQLNVQSLSIGHDVSAAGREIVALRATTAAGRAVIAAQRADLDRELEAREAVWQAAGGTLEAERGFRTRLHEARVRERSRDTRRRIGQAVTEQAARGGRGSGGWVASMEERSREIVEREIMDLEHAAMQASLSEREQALEQDRVTGEIEQRAARRRLDAREVELEHGAIQAYGSAASRIGMATSRRAAVQAGQKHARALHRLAQQRAKWAGRGQKLKLISSAAGAAYGYRGG